jgi:heat shock protein HslJ
MVGTKKGEGSSIIVEKTIKGYLSMKIKLLICYAFAGILFLMSAGCSGADPLDGTSWILTAYGNAQPVSGTTITATFQNGEIAGSAGCNSYFAPYQVKGSKIELGVIAQTEMACLDPEGVMEQEKMIMAFLRDAQEFLLANGQLQIIRGDGEALTFVAQD